MNYCKNLAVLGLLVLSACSAKIEDFSSHKPNFELFEFFEGKTKAWGMVQDYKGKQIRRFEVDIVGTLLEQNTLKLEEDFVYHDGKIEKRIWIITKTAHDTYLGKADDVIGEAVGKVAGNALNWTYTLKVQTENGVINLSLDDSTR
jgi:Protein of unknown function (DUF3833)